MYPDQPSWAWYGTNPYLSCQVGWYGNKRLAEYGREAEPRARLRVARGARPQATIDVPTAQALQVPT